MDFTLPAVFAIAFGATLLSTMSGGGANIIAIPLFLALGVPFLLVIAIMQVAATFWVIPAGRNYLRGYRVDWQFLLAAGAIGTVGAILGVLFLTHITQRAFEICFGSIILLLVLWLFFDKRFGLAHTKATRAKKLLSLLAALPMGAYELVFGSGNGIFFSLVGVKLRGYEFAEALGYYYLAAFPWVAIGAAMLVWQGHYDLALMSTAVLGAFAGGYLGSRFGRYKGNAFVKMMFCIIGFILGLKLVFGW